MSKVCYLIRLSTKHLHDLLTLFIQQLEADFKTQEMHDSYYDDLKTLYWSSRRVFDERIKIIGTCLVFAFLMALSILWIYWGTNQQLVMMGYYLLSNVVFHIGEFMLVCFYHYEDLGWKSNHNYQIPRFPYQS